MKESRRVLLDAYREALAAAISDDAAEAARRARRLGQEAFARGYGPLELALLDQEAVLVHLTREVAPATAARVARASALVFSAAGAAFALPAGAAPGNVLAGLNRELEARVGRLMARLDERQRLDAVKEELTSAIGHELRGPMTAIHGSLDLLQSGLGGKLPAEARRLVEMAFRNSDRLVALVSDLADLRKLDAGEVSFQSACVEVAPLLARVVARTRPRAKRLGIRLVLQAPLRPLRVRADAERLAQALANLVSNALRVAPERSTVVLAARRHGTTARLAVTDRGPSLTAGGGPDLLGNRAGAGVGLGVAKAILARMGGRVTCETTSGRVTFSCEIPLWRRERRAQSAGDRTWRAV